MNKDKIYDKFKEHRQIIDTGFDPQWTKAELNHQFYSGDEMAYNVGVQDGNQRKIVVFNRVKPFVNAISGFMIKLRRKLYYQAREQDQELQRNYTNSNNAFANYLRENANVDQLESRQDKEMLITGIGAIDYSISYVNNPNGEVKGETIKYDEFGVDPLARATNLLDARFCYRRKVMNRDDAATLFNVDKDDLEDAQSPIVLDNVASNVYLPTKSSYDKDLVQIYSYQFWEFENYYKVDNPLYDEFISDELRVELASAFEALKQEIENDKDNVDEKVIDDLFATNFDDQQLTMTKKTKAVFDELLKDYGIESDAIKHRRKCYYTAMISGKKVIKWWKSQDQNGFSIKFKTGDYDEVRGLWLGIVDQLMEPSRFANKALTEILYVIASNSKGGVMYEAGAVKDARRFEQQWSSTDAAIMVNNGALTNGMIQPKAQSTLPSGYENVLQWSKQGLFETTGVNPEFMGSSENKQVSALLESQRIEQTTSVLACYFDSSLLYQKEFGRWLLTAMQVLYENNPQTVFRATGEEGLTAYKSVKEPAIYAEYDIDIEEVPVTPIQRKENLSLMMSMAQQLLMTGVNIYPALIDDLPIKDAQKRKIKEALQPKSDPAQQQMVQQQAQLQIQKSMQDLQQQKIDINKTIAEIQKLNVDVNKTTAETEKTQAETLKSIEEAEQTDLENAQIKNGMFNSVQLTI